MICIIDVCRMAIGRVQCHSAVIMKKFKAMCFTNFSESLQNNFIADTISISDFLSCIYILESLSLSLLFILIKQTNKQIPTPKKNPMLKYSNYINLNIKKETHVC